MIIKYIKNISTYYLLFSIIIFLIFTYKVLNNFESINYNLKYLIIAVIMIMFSLLSFFIVKKIKIYINIILLSTIATLYAFELYLSYKKIISNRLSKITVIEEHKKKIDDEVVTVIPPSKQLKDNQKLFALSGISNTETVYCNEHGFYPIYKSDRYGFNNLDNLWDKKKIDYVLVGDSMVHGACVENHSNISGNLTQISNKNVLNLGMSGNSFLINYATLVEYVEKKKTERVIMFFTEENDLEGLNFEIENNILRKYFEDDNYSQNLKQKQSQLDKYLRGIFDKAFEQEKINYKSNKIREWSYIFKLYKLRSLTIDRIVEEEVSAPNTFQLFEKIVKKIKFHLKKKDIKFYVVYLPTYPNLKNPDHISVKYEKVMDILKRNEIETIDIYSNIIRGNENPKNIFALNGDGHFNRRGYRLISEIVYRKIKDVETFVNNN